MALDLAKQLAEFEADGEESVRNKLATNVYGEAKTQAADLWLDRRSRARLEASNAEQIDIAHSMKESARHAADAARDAVNESVKQTGIAAEANRLADAANFIAEKANRRANTANIIAITASLISIAALFISIK